MGRSTVDPLTLYIHGGGSLVNGGRVRLFGVDTPERGQHCYSEATERLRELAGGVVRVEAGPRVQDPFGRSLWYVFTEAGERA